MCGVFFGYWGLGGEGRGEGETPFVSTVGTMGTGDISSGLSLVFFVHVSKSVSFLMYKENS